MSSQIFRASNLCGDLDSCDEHKNTTFDPSIVTVGMQWRGENILNPRAKHYNTHPPS